MLRGGMFSETDDTDTTAQPETVGRVLYERFLVTGDLTDRSIGNGFSSFAAKDLKNFCREAVFKVHAVQAEPAGGSTLEHVCERLIRLAHPNIEEFLETGTLVDGRPYAVTLAPNGRTLADIVGDSGRLELSRIANMIEQAAEALAAAHSRKILHCDVRPSNLIVYDGDGGSEKTCLINFGSAWPVDVRGASLENLRPGSESLSYAAPELHAKLGHRSTASDIFSLAAVAYRLITGQVPFAGEDRDSLLWAINSGQMVRPTECRTDLTKEAENLILSALQFEPAPRPRDAEDFGIRLVRSLRPAPRITVGRILPVAEPKPIAPDSPAAADEIAQTEPDHSELRRAFKDPKPSPPVSDMAVAWALIIMLLVGALSIPIGQTLMAEEPSAPLISTMLARPAHNGRKMQLKYWFEQQAATDRESAQLVVTADVAGELFLISETANAEGQTVYRLILPTENAVAVEAEKPVRFAAARSGDDGKLWIVWMSDVENGITDVRNAADAHGVIPDTAARKLRHFLERNRNLRVSISRDRVTGQTVLDGMGERLVHRIGPGRS